MSPPTTGSKSLLRTVGNNLLQGGDNHFQEIKKANQFFGSHKVNPDCVEKIAYFGLQSSRFIVLSFVTWTLQKWVSKHETLDFRAILSSYIHEKNTTSLIFGDPFL
jgi:hypothetical protein